MPLFNFRVDVYHHLGDLSLLPMLEGMDMKLSELVPEMRAVTTQLVKVETETRSLVTKIGELEAIIAQHTDELPEDVVAGWKEVKDQAGVVDGVVDDVPGPTDPPTEG